MPKLFEVVLLLLFGIPISAIDLRTHRIPNRSLVAFALASMIGIFLSDSDGIFGRAIFALLTGFISLLCHLLTGRAIGMGDIKLIACLSLLVGALSILLNALIFATIFALIWRLKDRAKRVPMAPWLFIGTLAAILI